MLVGWLDGGLFDARRGPWSCVEAVGGIKFGLLTLRGTVCGTQLFKLDGTLDGWLVDSLLILC